MKKFLILLASLLGSVSALQAQSVTLNIDAGQLRSALGANAEPVGGLLQLIASPSGNFSAPTSTDYVTGDNVLVSSFAMNNVGGTAETLNALNTLPLTTSQYTLTTNEPLELRFYPNLTFSGMPASPTLGTSFGQVRSSSIEFGSSGGVPTEATWVVPGSGSNVYLEYVTVSNGGTYANANAYANGVVLLGAAVPEPSVYILFAGASVGLLSLRARNCCGKRPSCCFNFPSICSLTHRRQDGVGLSRLL